MRDVMVSFDGNSKSIWCFFFFSSRRRHTRSKRDWSSDECSSDLRLFVAPGEKLYEGMIIGIHSRDNDLVVNPIKTKKLTNIRAAGKDDAILLTPPIELTLE